ncbi:hypothetical protein [Cohnella mopanensis]|nr:hypothetical protein [Cohnella mopanensis]
MTPAIICTIPTAVVRLAVSFLWGGGVFFDNGSVCRYLLDIASPADR